MQQPIRHLVERLASTLDFPAPIYEFGSFRVPGQEELADMRPFFDGKEYIGVDMREGIGVDVILDMHNTELDDGAAGSILCLETLEHVKDPIRSLHESFRILKDDGIIVITSCFDFFIHSFPDDYWRFTPSAFRMLLNPFAVSLTAWAGGSETKPVMIVGVAFKNQPSEGTVDAVENVLASWSGRECVVHKGQNNGSMETKTREMAN